MKLFFPVDQQLLTGSSCILAFSNNRTFQVFEGLFKACWRKYRVQHARNFYAKECGILYLNIILPAREHFVPLDYYPFKIIGWEFLEEVIYMILWCYILFLTRKVYDKCCLFIANMISFYQVVIESTLIEIKNVIPIYKYFREAGLRSE